LSDKQKMSTYFAGQQKPFSDLIHTETCILQDIIIQKGIMGRNLGMRNIYGYLQAVGSTAEEIPTLFLRNHTFTVTEPVYHASCIGITGCIAVQRYCQWQRAVLIHYAGYFCCSYLKINKDLFPSCRKTNNFTAALSNLSLADDFIFLYKPFNRIAPILNGK
jgi:hypothetical protein